MFGVKIEERRDRLGKGTGGFVDRRLNWRDGKVPSSTLVQRRPGNVEPEEQFWTQCTSWLVASVACHGWQPRFCWTLRCWEPSERPNSARTEAGQDDTSKIRKNGLWYKIIRYKISLASINFNQRVNLVLKQIERQFTNVYIDVTVNKWTAHMNIRPLISKYRTRYLRRLTSQTVFWHVFPLCLFCPLVMDVWSHMSRDSIKMTSHIMSIFMFFMLIVCVCQTINKEFTYLLTLYVKMCLPSLVTDSTSSSMRRVLRMES